MLYQSIEIRRVRTGVLIEHVGQPDILVTLDIAIRPMILKSKFVLIFFITQIERIIKNDQNKKIIF